MSQLNEFTITDASQDPAILHVKVTQKKPMFIDYQVGWGWKAWDGDSIEESITLPYGISVDDLTKYIVEKLLPGLEFRPRDNLVLGENSAEIATQNWKEMLAFLRNNRADMTTCDYTMDEHSHLKLELRIEPRYPTYRGGMPKYASLDPRSGVHSNCPLEPYQQVELCEDFVEDWDEVVENNVAPYVKRGTKEPTFKDVVKLKLSDLLY